MKKLLLLTIFLTFILLSQNVFAVYTITNTIGDNSSSCGDETGYARASLIVPSNNGTLQTIGINVKTASDVIRLAIYDDSGGSPNNLLAETNDTSISTDWNDLNISAINITSGTNYWLGVQANSSLADFYCNSTGTTCYHGYMTYGSFPDPFSSGGCGEYQHYMRIIYTSEEEPTTTTTTTTTTIPTTTTTTTTSTTTTSTTTTSTTSTSTTTIPTTTTIPINQGLPLLSRFMIGIIAGAGVILFLLQGFFKIEKPDIRAIVELIVVASVVIAVLVTLLSLMI